MDLVPGQVIGNYRIVRPLGEVAKAFGVPNNSVSQIKTRVERMIADYEAMFAD